MTKPRKLTDPQGEALRELAGINVFTEQTVAQLNGLQGRKAFLEGQLSAWGVPLDTEPPPAPAPPEPEPRNRAEKRRAARKAAPAKKAPAKKAPKLAAVPPGDLNVAT